jgi:hypothetical protein
VTWTIVVASRSRFTRKSRLSLTIVGVVGLGAALDIGEPTTLRSGRRWRGEGASRPRIEQITRSGGAPPVVTNLSYPLYAIARRTLTLSW